MRYVVTLNNAKRSELESLGFRAVDLAVLREKRLNIPLTFIINNQAFEDFLVENGLRAKIDKAFQNKKASEVYQEIINLFNNAIIPTELETEILEAYESLAIDTGATASSIVTEWDYPFVSLIRSPSYLLSTEDTEGILHSIRGKEALLAELRKVWASVFSPKSSSYRKRAGISDSFGVGVLVQKMKKTRQSAVSYSCTDFDESTIAVKSFMGLQDYGLDEQVLGKDLYEVDADTLMIKKAQVNVQEFSLVRSLETDELGKHDLGEQGSRQKLDDKQVYEVARITKRAKSFIGKDLKLYLGVKDAYTYVFLANRLVAEPKEIIEEREEIKLGVDNGGEKVMEHKEEVITGKEEGDFPFNMPKIISEEEAREEVIREDAPIDEETEEGKGEDEGMEQDEEGRKREEEDEFDKILERDLEFLELIEKEEDKEEKEEPQEEISEEVAEEVNLLEEVMEIKEVIERMQEYALNNNKEAYAQEAKRLRGLVNKVRGE